MSSKRCILIDGSGYLFRAYHALPSLSRSDGVPTNAVLGFAQMLLGTADNHDCDKWAVVFDAGAKTFRNEIYSQYKAHRPPPPEDLIPQFAMARKVSSAMSIPTVELPGYEADDLIATYARLAYEAGYHVDILSSDKDLMQLVNDRIHLFDPLRQKRFDSKAVEEKFGVPPDKLLEVLSLSGDSADNVPGVPGIGIKTAALLIKEYGNLSNLLDSAAQIKQPKRREALLSNREQALLSRQLITLRDDVALPLDFSCLDRQAIEPELLHPLLQEYELLSLLRRMEQRWSQDVPQSNKELCDLVVVEKVQDLKARLARQPFEVLSMELGTHHEHGTYVGLYLDGESICAPVMTESNVRLGDAVTMKDLQEIIRERHTPTVVFDAKETLKRLYDKILEDETNLIDLCSLDAVVRGEKSAVSLQALLDFHGLECSLAVQKKDKDLTQEMFQEDIVKRSFAIWQVCKLIHGKLPSLGLSRVFEHIERPLHRVVAKMEKRGITIDRKSLLDLGAEFDKSCELLAGRVYQQLGTSFNLASPKQLGEVLQNTLKIEKTHRTRKGSMSTDAEALEKLAAEGHAVANDILEWRKLYKLKTTYCDGLVPYLREDRIHTVYNLVGARTGRMSSNEPNLQNIPIRTPEGRKLRALFVARPGYEFLSFDYNQIELRLLAEIAEIDLMRQAFQEKKDIHEITAEKIFGPPQSPEMKDAQRRRAKAINFGIIYGISAFGLARQIGVEQKEAKAFIEDYHQQFPGIRRYMEKAIEACRERGYSVTMFGRRVNLPDIRSSHHIRRQHAERQAINAPIQGTAADIIKRSMVKLATLLAEEPLDAHLLLQIHDELIVEVPPANKQHLIDKVCPLMERASHPLLHLEVPLQVGVGSGFNWNEAH